MVSNADIVASARGWIGTRFHHQGRLKKTVTHRGGVDCLGLLAGVATELDLRMVDGTPLARLDRTDYPHFPDMQSSVSVKIYQLSAIIGWGYAATATV